MDTIYSSMLFQYQISLYKTLIFRFFSREVKAKMPNELVTLNSKRTQFNVSFFPYFQHMVILCNIIIYLNYLKVPKQSNGTDCGLYLLQFVEMFAEDETYIMQRKEVTLIIS